MKIANNLNNVSDILLKIISFTEKRMEILKQNIISVDREDYVPMDLDTEQFAEIMACAVSEHVNHNRAVFADNENFQFGLQDEIRCRSVVDHRAGKLLRDNTKEYLKYELEKMAENTNNYSTARNLFYRSLSGDEDLC